MNRIQNLQHRVGFNSRDGVAEEYAAVNLALFQPAFGWTNNFSNQPASTFASAVNRLASIELAQGELAAYFANNGRDVNDAQWLDNLLPLNRPAMLDLLRAYQRIGVMVTLAELELRTEEREAA